MATRSDIARPRKPTAAKRGMALLYIILVMPLVIAFVSLGVDYAHVQLAKTELYNATTAAARAGAAGLFDGTYSAKAIAMAASNSVDGSPLVLQAGDIVAGTYSGGTFTPGGASPNAIQINSYRTNARGTAVSLTFGKLLGMSTCNVTCQNVIATATASRQPGFVGLSSFPINKKFFGGSYRSSVTTSPTEAAANSNCIMETNGVLALASHAGCHLYGNAVVGPSGSVAGGLNVHGSTTTAGSTLTSASPSMLVVTNPGSVSQTPTVSSNTTWPGGTYYFTSLTINSGVTLSFSGAATIYLNGNATLSNTCSMTAYHNIPSNMVINQASGKTFTIGQSVVLVGVYNGPGASVTIDNGTWVEGSMVANNMTLLDNIDFFFDEDLGTSAQPIIGIAK